MVKNKMTSKEKKYFTVLLPQNMAQEIEQLDKKHAYDSVREFVKDAVRRRLEELENDGK